MDIRELFDVIESMLATGPLTPADLILGLGAWATVGSLIWALASAIAPISVSPGRQGYIFRRAREKKAA